MKKQQTILKTIKNGFVTDFERFTVKTARGVLNQYKSEFSPYQFDNLFFKDYREADAIVIFATPDVYTEEKEIARFTPQEFFNAIS